MPSRRDPLAPSTVRRPGVGYALAVLAVVASLFPYASLPVTTSFGLQAAVVLGAAAYVFAPATAGLSRCLLAVMLLATPYLISLSLGTWFNTLSNPDIAVKSSLTLAISAATLLVVPVVAAQAGRLTVLVVGVALAVVVHGAAAVVQWVSFRQGVFPFGSVFALNPSFASFQDIADDYAHYVARVFGLFPEPSAMAAAIGPWLLVTVVAIRAHEAGSAPSRLLDSRAARYSLGALVVAGSVLIAASRSAYLVPYFVLLTLALLVGATGQSPAQLVVRRVVTVLALAGLGGYFVTELANRGAQLDNESWLTRVSSLSFGLEAWLDSGFSALVGVGPGESASLVTASFQARVSSASQGAAIYSFLLRYVSEAGIVGLLALLTVVAIVVRSMRRAALPRLGYLVLVAWLVSFGTSTSYEGILALWVLLGVMLLWDRFFTAATVTRSPAETHRKVRV